MGGKVVCETWSLCALFLTGYSVDSTFRAPDRVELCIIHEVKHVRNVCVI